MCFISLGNVRSKEERKKNDRITRRKSFVCDHCYKIIIITGRGSACWSGAVRWCGGAVRNFQAKEIERALVADPGPEFTNEAMRLEAVREPMTACYYYHTRYSRALSSRVPTPRVPALCIWGSYGRVLYSAWNSGRSR
jgi:hypothetical protein